MVGDQRRTYAQMEERANRLAHHLAEHGVGPGDHVGIYALQQRRVGRDPAGPSSRSGPSGSTSTTATSRTSCAYLFDNADLKALVYEQEFAPRVAAVRDALPLLRRLVVIDDGTGADVGGLDAVDYEDALAAGVARARLRRALRRRPLHPLHRRHHRHAEGRRVAPRGRLHAPSAAASTRTTNERVDQPEDARREGRSPAPSYVPPDRRRSCTAPRQWGGHGPELQRQHESCSWPSSTPTRCWRARRSARASTRS